MADNILKLRVESSEYDAKLKKAAEGIRHLAEVAHRGGGELTGLEKAELDYVKGLGSMETKSRTAAGGVRELESTFKEITVVYNNLNDVEKADEGGKALRASLEQIKQRAQAARTELENASKALGDVEVKPKGGFFDGLGSKMDGALAVFGGNLMTKAAGAVAQLGSEMVGLVQQGVELAKQGEGIRIAFERLGRGDILQGLREATHGTVTDLELMKAAVKFNDFKLPLEELGTMLAFAQQKAKDTGQSVDYMVDSIVTGLGRKSLMILDNLGLSASEIKERMKETGDMTKAVGAIIRDQMAKSGDYIETAADRATKADVELKNAMEELGRTFQPLADAGTSMWTALETGALKFLSKVGSVIAQLTEAGRVAAQYSEIGGSERVDSQLAAYRGAKDKDSYRKSVLASYDAQIRQREQVLAGIDAWRSGDRSDANRAAFDKMERYGVGRGDNAALRAQINALRQQRDKFDRGAVESTINSPTATTTDPKKGTKEDKDEFTEIIGLIGNAQERVSDLQRRIREAPDETTITTLRDQLKEAQAELDRLNGKEVKIQMETGTSIQNNAGISAYIASIKQQLETADYGTSLYNGLSEQLADMTALQNLVGESLKAGLGTAMFDAADATGKDFWTRAMEGGVEDTDWQAIIDNINEKLKELGIEPIKINFKTGNIANVGKETEKSWRGAASAMSAAGSALSGLEDPGAKIAGIIGQAIANIALGFAQATAKSTGGGIFGWIAAIAGGLTTMVSTIAAIHSATGYAQGGIVDGRGGGFVGGMAYSGDNVGNVRLDSGELVLNRAQQNNLANALEGDNNNNTENRQPYVNGELIYLGVNNYLKRTGRGEIVVSKR